MAGEPDELSAGELRRGSGALRLLLVEGLISTAWREAGFEREPTIVAPDLEGLADRAGVRLELAAAVVAGGGRQHGIDVSFIGAFRVDNPTTGVPAEATEGFAVMVTFVARDAGAPEAGDLDGLVERPWPLSAYRDFAERRA